MRKVVRAFPLVALFFATGGLSRAAWAGEQGRHNCSSYGDTLHCQKRGGGTTSSSGSTGGTTTSSSGSTGGTTTSSSGSTGGTTASSSGSGGTTTSSSGSGGTTASSSGGTASPGGATTPPGAVIPNAPVGAAPLAICPSGSTVISGGSISSALSSVASGGTLCLQGDSYTISSTVAVSKPVTILGVGGPNIVSTSVGLVFNVSSSNVTIQGLNITGPSNNRAGAGNSCSGTVAIVVGAVKSVGILNNTIDTFECGIEFENTDTFTANNNHLSNIVYVGIGTFPASNGTVDGNTVTNLNAAGTLKQNAYGLVASGPAGSPSSNINFTHNAVFYSPTWECFDNHGGNSISWQYNYCLAGGAGNAAMNAPGNGGNPEVNGIISNNQIDRGISPLNGYNSMVMVAGSGGSLTGGQVDNNLIAIDGTNCYGALGPTVVASGNTCNHNPARITSITASAGSFTHGQPTGVIATINVNMSLPFPPWMNSTYGFFNGWPGTLTITGSNPGEFQIVNGQLLQAPGGTPAGTYSVTIVATLPGLANSPQQVTLSFTGN